MKVLLQLEPKVPLDLQYGCGFLSLFFFLLSSVPVLPLRWADQKEAKKMDSLKKKSMECLNDLIYLKTLNFLQLYITILHFL